MKHSLPNWTVPLALIGVSFFSFGLLLPQLGFYWDDWPSVLIARQLGTEGFKEFFSFDRPTAYISYSILTPILGVNPFAWQLFTLSLRWGTSVAIWWFFGLLFPSNKKLAVWAAVLFAASPLFTQQSIAFTYHQLWMEFFFFVVSLAAMLQALNSPNRKLLWGLLAILAMVANYSISEYFLGIELLRAVFLFVAISGQSQALKRDIFRVIKYWLPFLAVTAGFVVWRLFFLQLPGGDRNTPTLLYSLITTPVSAVKKLIEMLLQDVSYILVGTWQRAIDPQWFDLDRGFYILVWGVSGVVCFLATLYLWRLQDGTETENTPGKGIKVACLVGLLIVLMAPLPGWLTGRQVTVGMYSERLAVPAMLGASLLTAGMLDWLLAKRLYKVVFIGILVGLATGINLRTANDYRWSWIEQKRLAWQLAWRAPSIQPGTALMADGELIRYVGHYSTGMLFNLVYPMPATSQLPYWFVNMGRNYRDEPGRISQGIQIQDGLRQLRFEGKTTNSLVISYKPALSSCLHILSKEDIDNPSLSDFMIKTLPASNLSRITTMEVPGFPPQDLFGAEPEHGWCYFYQKAALARQMGDWLKILDLAEQAAQKGYLPLKGEANTPQEWLPFLEAYLRQGQGREALQLSRMMIEKNPKMDRPLCGLWTGFRDSQIRAEAAQLIRELGCMER